jgi:TolB-like protein
MISKPGVAVLPLRNPSGDPDQQYFSDGITEDIITELSRYRELLVVARNSSFRYRDKSHDMKHVARELGVQYLVDGSLRRAGDHFRVTAQLIDAMTGSHLWAERYDRELTDVFAVQDEVSQTVASTLVGQIQRSHADKARRRPTESWAAYDYVLQARELANRYETQTAEALLNRAIELDPRYALAFGRLAHVYLFRYFEDLRDETLQKAHDAAQRGLSLDDEDPYCQNIAGAVHIWLGRFELAEIHLDRAVALNPNNADFIMSRAALLVRIGRTAEALAALDIGALRDPHLPPWYWETRSAVFFVERRYDDVIKSTSRKSPLQYWDHAYTAATHAYMGRDEDARRATAEVLRLRPDFSIRLYSKQEPYKDPADLKHLLDGFRKAGLPE